MRMVLSVIKIYDECGSIQIEGINKYLTKFHKNKIM